MKLTIVALAATAAMAVAEEPKHNLDFYRKHFENWMSEFEMEIEEKVYESRLVQFALNNDIIEAHNAGNSTYKLGHNKFSHMSWEEFKQHQGIFHPMPPKKTGIDGSKLYGSIRIPEAWDWVAEDKVTAVKNQGSCGSCWSFSAAGSIEGAYAIKFNKKANFSEQQMVDCDNVDSGCNGGLMDNAFGYVKRAGGLCTFEDYPYTGVEGTCQVDSCSLVSGSKVSDWVDVAQSEEALMQALAVNPVSVAIQANQMSFQLYKSGVFTGRCGDRLDHGVLAVGYGTDNGEDFWKVKNSWGTSWGEDGYIRISREGDLCGIQDSASYPILDKSVVADA